MKKILCSLAMVFGCVLSAAAMSYEEAREQALFLTDKMAYEINLNDEQYEYCYEINLDYLMSVETADDVYGAYLSYRNADLRHILFDWQYTIFAATDYFFHPLLWHRGVWTFPIYRHYTYGHFFYHRPHVYISYRGGHGRHFFGAGYYGSRRPHWSGGLRGHDRGPVAHRGDFGRGRHDSYGHTRSGHNGSYGHTRSGHSDNRSGYSIGNSRSNDDAYGLGSRTRGNRTGSFGSDNHTRSSIDHSSIGSTRSSSLDSRSTVGSGRSVSNDSRSTVGSSRSMNNDARTGSFSRGSSSSYNHPSSTRSFSGASRGSVATRSSSYMGGSRGGASMGSRSGASMGGSRGGSMGSSRGGGAMGGSRGGHSGRGR